MPSSPGRAAARSPKRLLLVLVGLTAFAGIAAGLALPGSSSAPEPAPAPAGGLSGLDALSIDHTGLWTALLLLAALGAALFFLARRARAPRGTRGRLEVLDTLPLAGRRFLHLVRCGDLRLLVGSSEAGLFRVAAIPPEGSAASIDEEGTFADLLEKEGTR